MELVVWLDHETVQKLEEAIRQYCRNCNEDPLRWREFMYRVAMQIEFEFSNVVGRWLESAVLPRLRKLEKDEELKRVLVEEFRRWLEKGGAVRLWQRSGTVRQIITEATRRALEDEEAVKQVVLQYTQSEKFRRLVEEHVAKNIDKIAEAVADAVARHFAKDSTFVSSLAEELKPVVREAVRGGVVDKAAEEVKERVVKLFATRDFAQQLAEEVKQAVINRFMEMVPEVASEVAKELMAYAKRRVENELKKEATAKLAEEARRNF